jgi:glycine/D-amino acid oxidase-like deaminating enzyme
MEPTANSAAELTTDEMAMARRWVQTWQAAAPELERLRREELRQLDPQRAIALLCGPADYTVPPRAPRPTSGLIEQQRWFMKAARRE